MDPYVEFAQFQRQVNQLFDKTSWNGLQRGFSAGNSYQLATDIKDNKDKYIISMDIPVMEKQNINVEVKNNNLLVSGERSSGYFSEVFPLPSDANVAAISVQYDKGVLKIEIPKAVEALTQQERPVTIKVN